MDAVILPPRGADGEARTVLLPGGRRLAYAAFGDPAGRPVLYFHGWPASRLEARLIDRRAFEAGLRIVAPDRPGMGRSDFLPGRRILDWPEDVLALAGALGLSRFAVLGFSGGGPYAAVCARRIPERLTSVSIVCGMGPADLPGATRGMTPRLRAMLLLGRAAPWAARPVMGGWRYLFLRDPDRAMRNKALLLPEPDRGVVRREGIREILMANTLEAFRQGAAGPAWDGLGLARPLGFSLADVPAEVRVWHGERDAVVPPAMGRAYEAAVPSCRAVFFPQEGHFSLIADRMGEVLETVA